MKRFFTFLLIGLALAAMGAVANSLVATDSAKLAGTTPSAYTLTLLDDPAAANWRGTLGLGAADSPSFDQITANSFVAAAGQISSLEVTDDAYSATTWNGSLVVPTKNAVRDKIESLSFQPLDSDLTIFAGITPSANVQTLLGAADYSAFRTSLGLVIGTNVQAYDADLTTYAGITPTANVQSLLGAADYAAMRTQLGVVIGTNVQAYDTDLTTYAGITPSANTQTFLGAANYAAMKTQLALTIGTDVQAFDADLDALAALAGTDTIYRRSAANTWSAVTFTSPVTFSGGAISVAAASTSASGISELATSAETTTGTDTGRTISPDGYAHSDYGQRIVSILVSDPGGSAITTGDGKAYWRVPSIMNGWNLVGVAASVSTVSSSGLPTVQIRRVRSGTPADMLTTKVSIDASETDSSTAATAAVIDTANDDVNTADQINVDIDVAGTGAKGLTVQLRFQLP
jgi:hypothetical protein